MKKIMLTMLSVCTLMVAAAQMPKCGIDTKALVAEEVAAGANSLRFVVKMVAGYDRGKWEKAGIHIGAQAGQIVTMTVPVELLSMLEESREVMQYSISHRIASPESKNMAYDTRTGQVHTGDGVEGGLALTGEGVYIGITDWGFDYMHPTLRDSDGKSRVVRAWDHYRLAGPAPTGFDYGTETVGKDAVSAIEGDTANLYSYGTHGTHVAGIAAGNGGGTEYIGQAPNADLLTCSFGLGEADWMDAVEWMRSVAVADGRRLVVNSSWGMYSFSTLDGTSLLSQAIDSWCDSGVVFCTSAGNNGDVDFHITRTFTPEQQDTLKTVASYYTYAEDAIGQCLIMWGDVGGDFEACFRMERNGTVWAIPMLNTANGDTVIYDTLDLDNKRIAYRALVEHANPFDGRAHIQIDVERSMQHKLQLFITADSGTVHAWNVANKKNHAGNEGTAFVRGNNVGFRSGDKQYGISEPACAAGCITVAAHTADTPTENGAKAYFTSSGPLIDGRQKPEISAPGVEVVSSISSRADESRQADTTLKVDGTVYVWAKLSGTSMASPATTGVVALMLQANPDISTQRVREIITTTARNDNKTGNLVANGTPSPYWGWGKVDALAAVNKVLTTVGIEQAERQQLPIGIYPNPVSGTARINTACGEEQEVVIYSMDGREVMRSRVTLEADVKTESLERGIYIVKVGSRTAKMVKL